MPIDDHNIRVSTASLRENYFVVVLLVDDQFVVGQMMGEMLAAVPDIQLHFCQDPLSAMALAEELAPTVILQDLKMPLLDGLSLLKEFRANSQTSKIPIMILSGKTDALVKAQAFALGASDYLVKLPDRVELIARLRHHSRNYTAQRAKNETHQEAINREQRITNEVAQAADYVQSLLPEPINSGPIRIDWRFIPSSQLGGDVFGYQWLDEQHFCIYLVDVSGHDIGASLLAASIQNTLRHRTLSHVDFRDPAAVMHALNGVFESGKHGAHFFTIWYGVFSVSERILTFSGGGHPPALLFNRQKHAAVQLQELTTSGPPIGVYDHARFDNSTVRVPEGSRLLLYSDGVIEGGRTSMMSQDYFAFTKFVREIANAQNLMDRVLKRCRDAEGHAQMTDDCSLIEAMFT